jgi:hypothetical protein
MGLIGTRIGRDRRSCGSRVWHTAGTPEGGSKPQQNRQFRLMGRQSSILVDPFSSLHHQCVAWILSG